MQLQLKYFYRWTGAALLVALGMTFFRSEWFGLAFANCLFYLALAMLLAGACAMLLKVGAYTRLIHGFKILFRHSSKLGSYYAEFEEPKGQASEDFSQQAEWRWSLIGSACFLIVVSAFLSWYFYEVWR